VAIDGIIVTFVAYLAVILGIGLVAYARTASLADYILGGRRLGTWVTALSAQASDMSGWLLMGLPGLAYMTGFGAIWLPIGLAAGTYLNWKLIAPRLREQSERMGNALTLPDYFEARFQDRTRLLRAVSALVILLFLMIYTAAHLVAGATLFESLFGLKYQTALTVGAVAILIYTAIGGFLAVSWSDALQGALMFLALLAAAGIGLHLLGGFDGAAQAAAERNPDTLQAFTGEGGEPLGTLGIVSMLAWGLGYFGQPHILARFMAIREPAQLRRSRWVAMTWVIACLAAAVAVGMVGLGYLDQQFTSQDEAERVFLELVPAIFPPVLAGICLAGILAAVMSTADSQLLVASSAISQDFYKAWLRPSAEQTELIWVGRLVVVVLALMAFGVAMDPESVLALVSYAWAGLGAAFGPALLLSLTWQRVTRAAVVSGMIVGGVVVIGWVYLAGHGTEAPGVLGWFGLGWLGDVWLFNDLYALVPGFVLAGAAVVLVSFAKSNHQVPAGE